MAQRDEWTNEGMKRLLNRPFCPECYLFLDEHDDKVCDMRWFADEQAEQERLEQRMCMECVEVGVVAVTFLASCKLWLQRFCAWFVSNFPANLDEL